LSLLPVYLSSTWIWGSELTSCIGYSSSAALRTAPHTELVVRWSLLALDPREISKYVIMITCAARSVNVVNDCSRPQRVLVVNVH
jgi:hypothetical protein